MVIDLAFLKHSTTEPDRVQYSVVHLHRRIAQSPTINKDHHMNVGCGNKVTQDWSLDDLFLQHSEGRARADQVCF